MSVAATQAQVEITITGATAFRSNSIAAIQKMYDVGYSENKGSAGNVYSANQVTWSGTMDTLGLFAPGTIVTVRHGTFGSTAGIASVANGTSVSFLANATPAGNTATVNLLADYTYSDVYQSSSTTLSPELEDNIVGVIPFVFVRSAGASTSITNVTAQLYRALTSLGRLNLSLFTGGTEHPTNIVNLVGRNSGSGTRATVNAESGLGPTAAITQRKLNATNDRWIADSVGFNSNSGVAAALTNTTVLSTNLYQGNASLPLYGGAIGFVDLSDANVVLAAGGNAAILTYEGVTYSKDAVRRGQYTAWGYEHLMHKDITGTDEEIFRDALMAQIKADLATSTAGIDPDTMLVTRVTDGATVTP